MEVEKLNQGELNRIEKYVEGIVRKKINTLQSDRGEREQAEKKLGTNNYLNKLSGNYAIIKKKIAQAEKDYCASHGRYEGFTLSYNWKPKNEALRNAKVKKVQDAHKEFTEALIFKSKPEILKAIRAIEKI